MDLNDIIRSFLGFRGPPGMEDEFPEAEGRGGNFGFFGPPGFKQPGRHDDDDDDIERDDNDDDSPFLGIGGGRGGILGGNGGNMEDYFFNFHKESEAMLRQMEDMFRNFGSFEDFHSESTGKPSVEEIPNRKPLSPRDEMLKSPDDEPTHRDRISSGSNLPTDRDEPPKFGDVFRTPSWHWSIPGLPSPADKQDKDLDGQVENGELDDILKPSREPQQTPSMRSFSKSVSIQTVRKPDGSVETRRTEKDSDGNVKTTVTTSQDGDQSTQIITPHRPFKEPDCRHGRWGGEGQHWSPWYRRYKPPSSSSSDDQQRQSLSDKLFGPWFK